MNIKKLQISIALIIISVATLTSDGKNRLAEPSVDTANGESYELRVYFNYLDPPKHEPQIKTQIKVGTLFFAKSESKSAESSDVSIGKSFASPLYVASGVLHLSEDGKFTLEHTFLEWWSPTSNSTYSSDGMQVELDKPQSVFSSDGFIHGYTVVLSKVAKMQDPQSNKPMQPTANSDDLVREAESIRVVCAAADSRR